MDSKYPAKKSNQRLIYEVLQLSNMLDCHKKEINHWKNMYLDHLETHSCFTPTVDGDSKAKEDNKRKSEDVPKKIAKKVRFNSPTADATFMTWTSDEEESKNENITVTPKKGIIKKGKRRNNRRNRRNRRKRNANGKSCTGVENKDKKPGSDSPSNSPAATASGSNVPVLCILPDETTLSPLPVSPILYQFFIKIQLFKVFDTYFLCLN